MGLEPISTCDFPLVDHDGKIPLPGVSAPPSTFRRGICLAALLLTHPLFLCAVVLPRPYVQIEPRPSYRPLMGRGGLGRRRSARSCRHPNYKNYDGTEQ